MQSATAYTGRAGKVSKPTGVLDSTRQALPALGRLRSTRLGEGWPEAKSKYRRQGNGPCNGCRPPRQIEAESFRRETGRLSAQQPIRNAQADAEAAEAAAEAAKERRESANSLAQLRTLARAINSRAALYDRSLKQVQEEIRVAVGTPIATSKKQKRMSLPRQTLRKLR